MASLELYRNRKGGFTIVELLIVIVVIGVLAAIVIIAYNNVSARARNNARVAEMQSWIKLFEAYRAANGRLPTIATGSYCLGTGFPNGVDGQPRCRGLDTTDPVWSYLESSGTTIATALSSVGRIPDSKKIPVGLTVGPYMGYVAGWGGNIMGNFEGTSAADCPAPTQFIWSSNGAVGCELHFDE